MTSPEDKTLLLVINFIKRLTLLFVLVFFTVIVPTIIYLWLSNSRLDHSCSVSNTFINL